MRKAMKAIWLSRHDPTLQQTEEIKTKGYTLVLRKDLGTMELNSVAAVFEVLEEIRQENPDAIFGVFASPLLAAFEKNRGKVSCFTSWNILRSKEGEKPSFEHSRFVKVTSFAKKGIISPINS